MKRIYNERYDTSFNAETGEWLEKIGFCPESEQCPYCKAFNEDGRPENGLLTNKEDWF